MPLVKLLFSAPFVAACALVLSSGLAHRDVVRAASFVDVAERTQPKMVKIFGAGGIRGLEAYQSGFLISPDGHVLTAWSYVLDPDYTTVVLHDGRKFPAQLVGNDPRLELALLKIDATDLDYFDLKQAVELVAGARILAFSNLFGVAVGQEATSAQHGVVSVVTTLNARRGTYATPYAGTVYVLDAVTNNAGAAGGAVTEREGRLVAILGKELRNSLDNTWLNYAIPVSQIAVSVDEMLAGKSLSSRGSDTIKPPDDPLTLARLGLVLVPDVLFKTPPFVDRVGRGSPAEKAGLRPDDLVVFVGERMVHSCKDAAEALAQLDGRDPVKLTFLRDQELVDVVLEASR